MTQHVKVKYRPDVDGLRAVAVSLVLLDHLHTFVRGGYVGVDVFFVISGYLISATIMKELRQGTFSIVDFYERRVRRIFPAMLVMMAVVTVLAYVFLLPSELMAYCRSLLAALFSGSNFLFWHEGGYFEGPSELKPMLHTWSLAVEEQFYLLFPVFLILVRRWFPARMKASILGVAAVSFLAACWTVVGHPVAAFFFAPLRAWELLAGTVVSQNYLPKLRTAATRNVASAVGLALIVVPALLYRAHTTFPGVTALAPCLGAAFIIAAGETGGSAVGSLLAWRPVVFVGLISYSLYLWHWPIIVFQVTGGLLSRQVFLTGGVKVLLGIVSLAVGALSWKYVEQPFRKGRFRPGKNAMFAVNGLALLALVAVAGTLLYRQGAPGRFTAEQQKIATYANFDPHTPFRQGECFLVPSDKFSAFDPEKCLTPEAGKPTLLLAGDSHAAALYRGLVEAFPERSVLQANVSGCPPLTIEASKIAESANCKQMTSFLFHNYLLHHRVDTLLLVARRSDSDLPALGETIRFLKGRGIPVVVMGRGIEYDKPEPRLIVFSQRNGHPEEVQKHLLGDFRFQDRQMAALARDTWRVPYVSVFDDLCSPQCPTYAAPGVPLVFDSDHMTLEAAALLGRAMRTRHQLP